jgi:NAD-dependent aldehyde dehydrogenases
MNSIEHFINGKIVKGLSKRTAKVFNPATGDVSSNVNLANTEDIDKAVNAAKKAFPAWSEKTPLFRARILFKFKELIEKNYDELTKIIVSEHGKVYEDAKGSLTRGIEVVEFACGIPPITQR